MITHHTTLQMLRKKYGSETACQEALLQFRKSDDGICFNPDCKFSIDQFYKLSTKGKYFLCTRCLHHFHVTVDSIMDHTHVDLSHWFEIIFKMLSNRNGASATEVHRDFGYSYPTIFRMLHLIRLQMGRCLTFDFNDTVVEIDTSQVKSGTQGLGRDYDFSTGLGSEHHTHILTIIERQGGVKFWVIPSTDAEVIMPIIRKNITDKNTLIYTDNAGAYNSLIGEGYKHATVNHNATKDRYVKGSASTNSAENIFSILKRNIRGTHHGVGKHYLMNYVNEVAFRHSFRDEVDYGFEIFMRSLPPLSNTYGLNKPNAA
jgi:hypothetical protein